MAKFGKWIGGGLGWTFAGPIGAILGFAIGSMFDNAQVIQTENGRPFRSQTRAGDFGVSLLILSAAVMKADGKVLKSELNYLRQFFTRQFGAADTAEKMQLFKEILKQRVDIQQVCVQIRDNMTLHSRLQLIHFLFGISKADGHVDRREVNQIELISRYMGIGAREFLSIKAMFYKDANAAYQILEINDNASDSELKKA